jgi:enoyl-CoA hydratase/carnithine racemase
VVDVHASGADLDAVVAQAAATPLAAVAFALLLRGGSVRSIAEGLVAESTTYSMLQAGPEFATWRAARPVRSRPEPDAPAVLVERIGDVVHVVLNRPHVHNALDARLRDGLADAFATVAADPGVMGVVLRGEGRSFCSGGDLDTFGSFPDPATSHTLRLTRSPARLLAALADRVEARLHGSCLGAGIELPGFAGRIVADPAARLGLPELALGLVPGAGGTVSLPRRIGRHRTAWLGLRGGTIDAATALDWGLVDAVAPVSPVGPAPDGAG